ncbi:DUF2336 domain-containing protein [Sphingosinicella sp. LHD-64]|uniref:DUF2336 domain-containing protein n=1 Tax=Sphingosinicella sp. LHD-64 TaxID=3072139 RepID=UPI00280EBBD4|nr:DUF2336 domain-containing protein [Sphingosinicella sp. LHD-64]MDQ8757949.1 DUF2336 domain-containing protein [Sphingosinicella sp. LHD-64]
MAGPEATRQVRQGDAARLLLAAARERFAVAATDLLLPDRARLTEWQRLTAASLLTRLVASIEDDLRTRLAGRFAANEALHAALSSAHVPIALPILERAQVLRDADLTTVLVRRAEEHRFWKAGAPAGRDDYLFELVRDADEHIASEAMALVIARSRRFDRFQEPVLGQVELPAELQHKLVWMVAAALRQYVVQHHHATGVDAAIEEAASALIAGYDEGESLESAARQLARRLHHAGRLDGAALARIIGDGLLPFFLAGVATLAALDMAAAWEVLSDPRGRGPALLLRAAGLERDEAGAVLLALGARGPLLSGAEGEAVATQLELYDTVDRASAQEVLRLWQAHPAYRASVARISTRTHLGEAA